MEDREFQEVLKQSEGCSHCLYKLFGDDITPEQEDIVMTKIKQLSNIEDTYEILSSELGGEG